MQVANTYRRFYHQCGVGVGDRSHLCIVGFHNHVPIVEDGNVDCCTCGTVYVPFCSNEMGRE